VRWLFGITIVLLAWLAVSSAIAFRLTRRPRAWFPEPAPRVAWGSIEDHRLRTRDGQEIGAWFVEGKDGDNAPQILLLHGNKGSRASSLQRAEFLASAGYPVLMISLRAHGDSTGDFNDIGFSARHDVVAAVEFLEQKHPGRSVVVMGVSLGSAAAIFASQELGRRVHGYILESPYRDLKTAVWNRTQTYLPPVLAPIGYAGLRLVGPLFLPDLDEVSPLQAIGGIPSDIPVLILAGEADPLARPAEARALYDRVASHGELKFFPGADHHNLFLSAPDRYRRTVLDFCGAVRPSDPAASALRFDVGYPASIAESIQRTTRSVWWLKHRRRERGAASGYPARTRNAPRWCCGHTRCVLIA
jgi:alpha-beta hydrolase superfamily lysophospholipase